MSFGAWVGSKEELKTKFSQEISLLNNIILQLGVIYTNHNIGFYIKKYSLENQFEKQNTEVMNL